MAQGVVDDLEAVQVDEQRGERLSMALGVRNSMGETVFEQDSIGQTGQTVVIGQAVNRPFGLFAFGDVLCRADDRQLVGFFFPYSFGLQMNREIGAVREDDPMVDVAQRAMMNQVVERPPDRRAIVGVDQLEESFEGASEVLGSDPGQTTELIRHRKAIRSRVPIPVADPGDPLGEFQAGFAAHQAWSTLLVLSMYRIWWHRIVAWTGLLMKSVAPCS